MKYSNAEIKHIFSQWCKAMKVPEATNTMREPSKVGTYLIPNGISGWGIARYVNNVGAIHVIFRASSGQALVDAMQFAIGSTQLKKLYPARIKSAHRR